MPISDRSIPGYTLLRPLGRGGMATVYLARQDSLGREVALKLLTPSPDAAGVAGERFLREARIAASLRHPHIVAVHDFGVHEGTAYLAMDYEPGGTVAPPTGERLAPRDALRVVRDIASALDHAHARGVVHRDIKPDNILRREDGSATLADFGIARLLLGESQLTAEGTSVGTPLYMSPEQLRGEKVDGRSDLYGLGIVLFQLLTGELPYTGADHWAIGSQHIGAPLPRLPDGLAHLQPLLDALLAKQPEARLASGAELVRRIDAALAIGDTPTPAASTVVVGAAAGGDTGPGATPASAASAVRAAPAAAAAPAARGPRAWRRPAIVAAVCAVLAVAGWLAWKPSVPAAAPGVPQARAAAGLAPPAAATETSVAVLPFVNLSTDPEQAYFSEGLSEDLITVLSQAGTLRVIGRDSSFQFRGREVDSRAVGARLGVTHLLSGSVRRAGEVVRIRAALVNTADGSTLWSQHYDRPFRDLFALQDEIAAAVAGALKARLLGPTASTLHGDRPASGNLAAYTAFLQGRFHSEKSSAQGLRAALADLDKAIALDPAYAQAYAARAYVRTTLTSTFGVGTGTPGEAFARADADIERAIALSPGLASAHLARALVAQSRDMDVGAAEAEFQRAVRAAPDDPRALRGLALAQAMLGRYDEAAQAVRQALRVDPLNAEALRNLATIEAATGDLDAAEGALRRALELQPDGAFTYNKLSLVAIRRGDAAAAMRYALREPAGVWRDFSVAMAAQVGGDRAAADRQLAAFTERYASEAAFQIADLHALRGDADQAMAWLDRARKQHDSGVVMILLSPFLLDLRADPRLVAFSESVGTPIRDAAAPTH